MAGVKIFVGNVQTDSTPEAEAQLKEMFEVYGVVNECDILTGKNYGFVHMSSEDEAITAIDNLNGALFFGANINVEISGNQSKGKSAPRGRGGFGGSRGRGGFDRGGRGGPRGRGGPPMRGRGRGGFDRSDRGGRYDPYARDHYPPPPRDPYERYPPPPLRDPYDRDPYARDPYARDPYARDPYARDPYARDPYARDPYAPPPRDPYARDPYARDPYARDPYARLPPPSSPTDPYARPPPEYYDRAPRAAPPARDPYDRAAGGGGGGGGDRPMVAYPKPVGGAGQEALGNMNGNGERAGGYAQPQMSSLYTSFD